jgi:transcriptional regulator with XRE-family HTH domain
MEKLSDLRAGEIIKLIRIKKKIGLNEFAKKCRINKSAMSRYESGKLRLSNEALDKISIGLNIDPGSFLLFIILILYYEQLKDRVSYFKLVELVEKEILFGC